MTKFVFAAVLAFSAAVNAQIAFELPRYWFPEEFTGKGEAKIQADVQMIVDSKNVRAYMKLNGLGAIEVITWVSTNNYTIMYNNCQFSVVIRANSTPNVLPVENSLNCGE